MIFFLFVFISFSQLAEQKIKNKQISPSEGGWRNPLRWDIVFRQRNSPLLEYVEQWLVAGCSWLFKKKFPTSPFDRSRSND